LSEDMFYRRKNTLSVRSSGWKTELVGSLGREGVKNKTFLVYDYNENILDKN